MPDNGIKHILSKRHRCHDGRRGMEHQGCPSLPFKYVHGKLYYIATPASEFKALVPDRRIRLACNFVAKVATLRCEVGAFAQALDPAEEEL
jgi:hypothetical protein